MFFLEVIKGLNAAKIKYALVGGYAVNLHGAQRGTMDIDLVIALDKKSFLKIEEVLKSLGLTSRLPVNGSDVFLFRNEYISKRNMIAWSFTNFKKPNEVVDIIITEDARKMKIQKFSVHNTPVKVASIEDLIQMKKKSKRPQDLSDIDALKRIKDGKI